jgi:hypothetical protein
MESCMATPHQVPVRPSSPDCAIAIRQAQMVIDSQDEGDRGRGFTCGDLEGGI